MSSEIPKADLNYVAEEEADESLAELFLNPVAAFRLFTGHKPYPYQAEVLKLLEKQAERVLLLWARQVGKTEVLAFAALWQALMHPNQTVLVVAGSLRQAKFILSRVREFLLVGMPTGKCVVREMVFEVAFDNGSTIIGVPASASTIRGFTPTMLIIDEAAFVGEDVFVALEPSIARRKGALYWISSTPFGKRGKFWEYANSDFWTVCGPVTAMDCPDYNGEYLEKQRLEMSTIQFRQEYLAEFIEEANAAFTHDLVMRCIKRFEESGVEEHTVAKEGWRYWLGVDPARYGEDDAAFVVLGLPPGSETLYAVHVETLSKCPLTEVIGKIEMLHGKFGFEEIGIQEVGMDAGVYDVLSERHLPLVEHGRGPRSREEVYSLLEVAMNADPPRVAFSASQEKLRRQLLSLEIKLSSSGSPLIHHPSGGHDDLYDALGLAYWVAYSGISSGFALLDPSSLGLNL